MPAIDSTAFRTIIGASLTTTALLEGTKELYKRHTKRLSSPKLPCSSCGSKSDKSKKEKNTSRSTSPNPSAISSNPFADPRYPTTTKPLRRRSSSVNSETGGASHYQGEIEHLRARLHRYEITSWLPIAFTVFHEYPLNTWHLSPLTRPRELSPEFHTSLVLLRNRLRCRTPHELASILRQLADSFSGSSVDWEEMVELDGGRWASVGDLFWAPGPKGIGRPERFWRDALSANKGLPEINAAEIMIGTVVERRGYGREGYAERMVELPRLGRERVDSGVDGNRDEYGGMEKGREGNGYAESVRSATESERERSREKVVKWEY